MLGLPRKTRPPAAEVQRLLGPDRPVPWWRRPWPWLLLLALLAAGWGWQSWRLRSAEQAKPVYVTEPIKRGDLVLNVTANGTLQPVRAVNVGSELSGTVREVLVDVNDRVQRGQVLVVLDTAKLQDQVHSARAALASAEAQVQQADASAREAEASLRRLEELARLSGGVTPAPSELDAARAALQRAQAQQAVARAAVEQARATLSTNETNLAKASIRSPIDGVVLARNVDPGNAVAASLQAVTLLTIAQDLRRLKLDVAVDEADVGHVREGQSASFTVSAYPRRRYPAKVGRVAYGATKTDNVVTYTATLDVANDDLSLRPGMTATATIRAAERNGVLLVPNTALRFTPTDASSTPGAGGGLASLFMPKAPTAGRKTVRVDSRPGGQRQLWVLRDGQPQALPVTVGISDGRFTEVSGDGLDEGLPVIVEQRSNGRAR
ncbi:MAG: efflux RND transporter periplasmic adaptor subunit [Tepidimonas sp.]|uniref:efflux RND transporter periplasmic adaptor subunit n=1 Tax=Tepidimonas sp. TaxID=2002775 RepID=UPI00298F3072|nr:efflux RND transporter periplasmic adaptor subunit [Tepidimonas sp.]MCS6811350.1 efflux RND transporter periplasmic adaptor subunit [Tepidimonas sp.]MCX7742280.1 efflux RND transporter periplasmic adaptor subunit [Tepidimonas sp.]MDW8335743.1 efflux RND transporter periplasmic adaptor subunit [Tepidimonas sp.]